MVEKTELQLGWEKRIKKILLFSLASIMLWYAFFIMSLPFSPKMWHSARNYKHRMINSLEQRLVGMTEHEVVELLGNYHWGDSGTYAYIIKYDSPQHLWLIISFDENHAVYKTHTKRSSDGN